VKLKQIYDFFVDREQKMSCFSGGVVVRIDIAIYKLDK
jgi:hypothetical protein